MSSHYIPPSVIKKMNQRGISESEVHDVFNSGEYKTTSRGVSWPSKNI